MTDAPYPASIGKGRTGFLPVEMQGKSGILKPYGGKTGEEFMEADSTPSEFQDKRPNTEPEVLGDSIIRLCKDKGMKASDAADYILGTNGS